MKIGDLQRIYGAAGRELRTVLLGVDLATFDGAKAEEIKKKARRIVTYLNAVSGKWTQTMTRAEYAKAEAKTKAVLARLGKNRPRGPEPGRSGPDAVQGITERALLKATGSITQTVERYVSAAILAAGTMKRVPVDVQEFSYEDIGDEIGDLAREAVRQELSRGALQKNIMDKLRQLVGDENFIQIGGRLYNLSKYAKMVARKALLDAQTAATLDNCKRFENDLVEITNHHTDCKYCQQFEGKVYSISGNSPNYPSLDSSGFLETHPNCKHGATPTSEEEISVRGRE